MMLKIQALFLLSFSCHSPVLWCMDNRVSSVRGCFTAIISHACTYNPHQQKIPSHFLLHHLALCGLKHCKSRSGRKEYKKKKNTDQQQLSSVNNCLLSLKCTSQGWSHHLVPGKSTFTLDTFGASPSEDKKAIQRLFTLISLNYNNSVLFVE